jgi:concentrative nucleoside transporter, CNT family
MGVLGVLVLLALAWLASTDRRAAFNPRILLWGLGLQVAMALLTLQTPLGARLFLAANAAADAFIGFTDAGIRFVFGAWPAVTIVSQPTATGQGAEPVVVGFVLAIKVLPIIVFVASLMAILYYLGVMQRIVALLARGLSRLMGISGAEALSSIGDVFLGMTEAPLLVRPYVARMTDSELFTVMTAGMATIAGTVLLSYTAMGIDAGYLVTASFMSAPAAIMIAKIMVPEKGTPETMGQVRLVVPRLDVNVFDAAARGASEGLHLALNVGAMLLAFVALVNMIDAGVGAVWGLFGLPGVRLGTMLGWPLAPLAWLMGVPWSEAPTVGTLLGTKIVLNEFLAYRDLAAQAAQLSPKTVRIATFALCGFANFGSLGVVLGGLGSMVPERRADLARFGLRAIFAGSIVTCLTATLAGLLGGTGTDMGTSPGPG